MCKWLVRLHNIAGCGQVQKTKSAAHTFHTVSPKAAVRASPNNSVSRSLASCALSRPPDNAASSSTAPDPALADAAAPPAAAAAGLAFAPVGGLLLLLRTDVERDVAAWRPAGPLLLGLGLVTGDEPPCTRYMHQAMVEHVGMI